MTAQRRPARLAVTLVGAIALLTACTGGPDETPSPSPPDASASATTSTAPAEVLLPTGTPQAIATGLDVPWSVAFLEGTPLVSERDTARILELTPEGESREVGVVEGVVSRGEAGLLGLAVDDQRRLYVYSTAADGNRVQRFEVSGEPGSLSLGEPTTLIDGLPAAGNHDGGRIAFGPDGMLYATVGDAGRPDSAQDLESLAGKILRMTPDGDVPADNPFDDSLVYSYGHRNPQGLAWAQDGTMFATEFGQDTWDELNVITAGGNYGWPVVEGIAGEEGYLDPVQQWNPDVASPSGMARVDGTLFLANLRGRVLRAVPVSDPATSTDLYSGEYGRIRDVVLAPDGRLWFVTQNTDGRGDPGPDDDRILAVDLAVAPMP